MTTHNTLSAPGSETPRAATAVSVELPTDFCHHTVTDDTRAQMATGRDTEQLYRRAFVGLWVCSGIALAVGTVVGYPLVGVAGFVGCGVASLAVVAGHERPLFDERDEAKRAAASRRTLTVVGVGSAVVFPTVTALWALNVIRWPRWLTPVALFVAGLGVLQVGSLMYGSATDA